MNNPLPRQLWHDGAGRASRRFGTLLEGQHAPGEAAYGRLHD
ncbi:MAG TPA: hypothetical protein PK880_11835 [Candidatus Competibacter sp.]|nr:hypothetical protein [Candidatus Competibacter sp.]